MVRWHYLLVVLLIGCGSGPERLPFPDGGFNFLDSSPPTYLCTEETDLETDFRHCGACEAWCAPADADHCVDGECRCGIQGPCAPGSDCREGACIPHNPEGYVCEFDDVCLAGYACIEGRCSFVACVPEVCDGYDNDCDGVVDNNGEAPLAGYCSGMAEATPGTVSAPCSIGTRLCVAGEWSECLGDVPPQAEVGLLACNGVDDDCDGCIDGVEEAGICESREPQGFDVLFLIDQSGSMSGKVAIVKEAVRLFSTRLSTSTSINYGTVRIPGPTDGLSELYQDLTDFTTFEASLQLMTTGGGGREPQWDAVVESLDGTLPVSWTPGYTRIIILFTDEEGQTRAVPPNSEMTMCEAITDHGVVFIPVITTPFASDFDDCAFRNVPLLAGVAGTRAMCSADGDCAGEICGAGQCVSMAVIDTVANLEFVISDPCGG